ncbi:MAG TPA: FHA domain-containing protein [Casimicrobiaceae bacterium]|nr:FHA domain-containing protein [Casimicrobiaceae bacterium]
MARLIAHLPDGTTRQFKLEPGRTTIGRRADNDVCLPFPAISAEHAAVVTIGADSFLEDLESTNGTLVNGERVSKHFLRDGDRIDIGRLELVYLAGDETKAESLSAHSSGEAQDRAEPESDAEAVAAELSLDTRRVEESFGVTEDADAAPADELLAELMETQSPATAAVDIPPTLSVVPPPANPPVTAPGSNGSKVQFAEALVTILSGPNAGKTTPMTRAQFVFGRPGVTVAAIRRSGGNYRLVPLGGDALPTVNGDTIAREGIELSFGDTIDVAGVRLRFERRA